MAGRLVERVAVGADWPPGSPRRCKTSPARSACNPTAPATPVPVQYIATNERIAAALQQVSRHIAARPDRKSCALIERHLEDRVGRRAAVRLRLPNSEPSAGSSVIVPPSLVSRLASASALADDHARLFRVEVPVSSSQARASMPSAQTALSRAAFTSVCCSPRREAAPSTHSGSAHRADRPTKSANCVPLHEGRFQRKIRDADDLEIAVFSGPTSVSVSPDGLVERFRHVRRDHDAVPLRDRPSSRCPLPISRIAGRYGCRCRSRTDRPASVLLRGTAA